MNVRLMEYFSSPHELKVAMRALGFDVKKQEVMRIIEDADRSGNASSIEFSDFMEISTFHLLCLVCVDNLSGVFSFTVYLT